MQNHFLPTHKLEKKERKESRIVRVYGEAQTPLTRVLASSEVTKEKSATAVGACATQSVSTESGHRAAEETN